MTGSCPDSAFHGIITAVGIVLSMIISGVTTTHGGGSNFAISVLDASNESTGQFAVNTIGKYSGTTAFGFNSAEEPGHEGQDRAQHRRADTRSVGTCATRTPAR